MRKKEELQSAALFLYLSDSLYMEKSIYACGNTDIRIYINMCTSRHFAL